MAYDEQTPFNLVDTIAAMFGDEVATRFMIDHGGREIRVPVRVEGNESTPIVAFLGPERAAQVCDALGDTRHYVRFERARHVKLLLATTSLKRSEIGRACGISERQVSRIASKAQRKDQPRAVFVGPESLGIHTAPVF